MLRTISTIATFKEDEFLFVVIRGALYPLILIAETLRRLSSRATFDEVRNVSASNSIFRETSEQASITASYLLMARATYKTFGRRPRTERPS